MTNLSKTLSALPSGADGLLLTSPINQRYLTGFDYTDGYVLLTRGGCYVFADSRYIEAAKAQVCSGFEVILLAGGRKNVLGQVFEKENVKLLAFEDREMTVDFLSGLKNDFPGVDFTSCGALMDDIREIKSNAEKEKIVASQRIAEKAFDHILGYITPERTESDVALELEFTMRRLGAERVSFDIIAVSGRASSMPHGVPRHVKLERGFLTLDFGAAKDGYLSDMTRTVCVGRPDDDMKRVYETVLEAQLAAIEFAAPGKRCADVDMSARSIISDAGFGECFGHGLGHGVGMLIHEAPRVSPGAGDKLLAPGHVVTVEPGIYIEGKYGVRIEDMLYITENGSENLTNCPKNLIVL
ncbi:MAG: aminopeptidase P family protein [Eubacteriales bacterium]